MAKKNGKRARPEPADDHLDTEEAARFIGLRPGTLADWRSNQAPGSPPFRKIGHYVWYRKSSLVAWMDKNEVSY